MTKMKGKNMQVVNNQFPCNKNNTPTFGIQICGKYGILCKSDSGFDEFISQNHLNNKIFELCTQADELLPGEDTLVGIVGRLFKKLAICKTSKTSLEEPQVIGSFDINYKPQNWFETIKPKFDNLLKNSKSALDLERKAEALNQEYQINMKVFISDLGDISHTHTPEAMDIIARTLKGNDKISIELYKNKDKEISDPLKIYFSKKHSTPSEHWYLPNGSYTSKSILYFNPEADFKPEEFKASVKEIIDDLN